MKNCKLSERQCNLSIEDKPSAVLELLSVWTTTHQHWNGKQKALRKHHTKDEQTMKQLTGSNCHVRRWSIFLLRGHRSWEFDTRLVNY